MSSDELILLAKLPFEVPDNYISYVYTVCSDCGKNLLYSVDDIWIISDGKELRVLNKKGIKFVQLQYVEHTL